ncbi:MAG: SDR family oxidoreductase [Microcoleaceae cyanobacterium MO_207.B10]|nr:SDR family oxidoreductase [Microcoleaceae cyanobacterium MO_207.B10]
MQKNKLLIILGVAGVLGSFLTNCDDLDADIFGIDIHQTTNNKNLKYYFDCDFKDRNKIRETIEKIPVEKYQKHLVVSCIGTFAEPTFNSTVFEEEKIYESIQVNLIGTSHFVIGLLKKCLAKNIQNRVVIVGSAAAYVGSRDIGYGVAKAGLNGLVLSLSKSLSSKESVIIGINPGIFESKMSKGVSVERQNQAVESTHIKRKGRIEEIANFVKYVAFDAPDYLTGSILNINGGQYT